jgi:oligopeptide/dipeptide ABC transporter ATP-binding protein
MSDIAIENLTISLGLGDEARGILDDITFSVRSGQSFGLVGESGSGKSTILKCIGLLFSAWTGRIEIGGKSVRDTARKAYCRDVQMVFQDPYGSLHPRHSIRTTLNEPLAIHGLDRRAQRMEQAMVDVGLPASFLDRYPHELSGGQRQRVALARALTTNPECILLDEAVSALDVSIRAQVMNLLREIQDRSGVSYLFIAHDLAVVKYVSTRIGVMYLGRLVETAGSEDLYARPLHPYTQILLNNALPAHPDETREEVILRGEVPSAFNPPPGCRFHPRCPHRFAPCDTDDPTLLEAGGAGHRAACHLLG